jgi:BirA family transcriptional regulator, biotin operon repressor / biotin---[acetyl-CoA-carboxylase] ligase
MKLPGIEARRVERCGSTNEVLLAEGRPGVLLVARHQTAGRGRRGRRWHSAPGAGLTFSLSARAGRLAGLPLAAGIAVARALRGLGAEAVELKWPNDLVVRGAKLGGILVQTRAALAVIGIGINVQPDAALARRLDRPVAFLADLIATPGERVIEAVAKELLASLSAFEARGLQPSQWEAMDAHAGARLRVRLADGRVLSGLACGVSGEGALRLETRTGLREIHSGRILI